MRAYELIAISKSVDGKVSLAEVSKFLKNNYKIAPRTMQSYMKKGMLPKPKHREWKNWFYTTEAAKEVFGRAYLIMKLREYRSIPFSMVQNIFRRYKNNIDSLIEKLLSIAKDYTWYEPNSDPYEPVLNERHAEIMRTICEKIEAGESLESINAAEIEMDHIREG